MLIGCEVSDNASELLAGLFGPESSAHSGGSGDDGITGQNTWPPAGFIEQAADQNTRFPDTVSTDVGVSAPLPSTFAEHPAECDCLHFLRIRHVRGPENPSDADRVLIAQPGVLEGAGAFYNVGANLVSRAYDEKGKFVEFWAIDRRSNCLEDMNGLKLAQESGDLHDLVDYYYRGKPYQGKTFQGYINPFTGAKWLVGMGMEQTLIDWNEVITRGVPDRSVRQEKVFIGGHSLGGFITGAYATADFDGDPLTTGDAGYNQCAGYFALDSVITSDPMAGMSGLDLNAVLEKLPVDAIGEMIAGYFERFVSIPGAIDPEIMSLLTGVGYAAKVSPAGESDLVAYLPANLNVNLCYRLYHSRDLYDYLFMKPTIKDFRYTNRALLALFMDDNSMPISIIQASVGFFKGGPVADKNFPVPQVIEEIEESYPSFSMLASALGKNLAIPIDSGTDDAAGPLYDWYNYNELSGIAIPAASDGEPYTDTGSEVTDINDLARSVGAYPLDFVEKYFPMRLIVDSMLGTDWVVHGDGVSKRPLINITAGDGPQLGTDIVGPVVPGYNHLDVLTASPVQNNGQPEPVTSYLLDFIF